jgi:hypothetical protein
MTIPYLKVGPDLGFQLMRLDSDAYDQARNDLVDKVYANAGHTDPAPPAWSESPLTRWCWLVLEVNDLERDPDIHHPLIHWGIDFGFAPTELREWIWAIS